MDQDQAATSASITQAVPVAGDASAHPFPGMFSPGDVLLDRFHIVRLIGRGGMGEVYEAQDMELGRIALKTVRAGLATPEMLRLFRQEVQIARKVTGPHVCRIHELFTLPPIAGKPAAAFLTMEYLEGETLAERLRAGPLPPQAAQQIALDLCAGLESIHHAGILHRDLKARNVMLVRRDSEQVAVLTDFGLALSLASDEARGRAGGAHGLTGTPDYMAPEQFSGDPLTPAADIYALGILLYEMATGSLPFHAHTPLEAAVSRARQPALQGIPHGWREITHRCLEVDLAQRYQSASDVAVALRRTRSRVKLATHDTAVFAKRFRIVLLLVAVGIMSVAGFYAVRRMSLHNPPREARKWYGKGLDALRAGTYVKAIHALEAATDNDPRFAMAHARLAEAWSELDFDGKANEEMLKADATAHEQRMSKRDEQTLAAVQATLTRDYSTAERRYRDLADNAPEDEKSAALVDLGRVQEKAGEIPAALTTYHKAAERGPDQPAPFVHIGILESRALHKAQAQAAFAQAEKFYSADDNREGVAEIEYQQGYLANANDDSKTALAHLNIALSEARAIPSIQMEIRVLTQMSSATAETDANEAAALAIRAISLADANELQPWAADGWVRLANSYLEAGDDNSHSKAEDALQHALQIAHDSGQPRVEAIANVSLANLNEENPQQAAAYAQKAFDYYSRFKFGEGTQKSGIMLARAQLGAGNLDAAYRSGTQLLALAQAAGSQSTQAYAEDLIASVWLARDEYPKALAMYQQSLSDASPGARPYEAKGCAEALWQIGRFAEAEKLLASVHPDDDTAEIRAQMAISRGNFASALTIAKTAEGSKSPGALPADLLQSMAIASARMNRTAEAEMYLSAAPKPGTPPAKADLALASSQVHLAAHELPQAIQSGQQALDYYKSVGARASALQAALLLKHALEASNPPQDSTAVTNFALDIQRQLQQSWTPEDFQSFSARPDITAALRQLRPGAERKVAHQ